MSVYPTDPYSGYWRREVLSTRKSISHCDLYLKVIFLRCFSQNSWPSSATDMHKNMLRNCWMLYCWNFIAHMNLLQVLYLHIWRISRPANERFHVCVQFSWAIFHLCLPPISLAAYVLNLNFPQEIFITTWKRKLYGSHEAMQPSSTFIVF